ncbi:MAG: flavodoxin domain-containing protein [Spirochaetales bacterium]|nr:flavodoxin domain-containing protein [Spirochaetales bacterium]
MKNEALIIYGSSKGRTARIAQQIGQAFAESDITYTLKNVFEARPEELSQYAFVILGSSTYGQGDLQRDFLDFERGMDDLDLTSIHGAVFGSGNSRYTYFAEAVDILEAKIKILNGRLLLPSLKQDMMEGSPDSPDVTQWIQELVRLIKDFRP